MADHKIVSRQEWLAKREQLLYTEKRVSLLRDKLNNQRRSLPWVRVEEDYVFDDIDGKVSLSSLFDGRSQLIVYHFMFEEEWDEGCKMCSLIADHLQPAIVHLAQKDVTLLCISRADINKLNEFKERMGWKFRWLSSLNNDFNYDFNVSFRPEDIERKRLIYNYQEIESFPSKEAPGLSVFCRNENGEVFHTYSTYARGLDILIGTYNLLDLVPKGRNEEGLSYPAEWVRHHDRYEQEIVLKNLAEDNGRDGSCVEGDAASGIEAEQAATAETASGNDEGKSSQSDAPARSKKRKKK